MEELWWPDLIKLALFAGAVLVAALWRPRTRR